MSSNDRFIPHLTTKEEIIEQKNTSSGKAGMAVSRMILQKAFSLSGEEANELFWIAAGKYGGKEQVLEKISGRDVEKIEETLDDLSKHIDEAKDAAKSAKPVSRKTGRATKLLRHIQDRGRAEGLKMHMDEDGVLNVDSSDLENQD